MKKLYKLTPKNMKTIIKILLLTILLLSALYIGQNSAAKSQITLPNGSILIIDAKANFCDKAPECYTLDKNGEEILTFGDDLITTINEMDNKVYKRAKAISKCEGFYKDGSLAQINRNPGNLKKSGHPRDNQGHSIFDSEVDGWLHLYELLYKNRDHSIYQISSWYATDRINWLNCVNSKLYGNN